MDLKDMILVMENYKGTMIIQKYKKERNSV